MVTLTIWCTCVYVGDVYVLVDVFTCVSCGVDVDVVVVVDVLVIAHHVTDVASIGVWYRRLLCCVW